MKIKEALKYTLLLAALFCVSLSDAQSISGKIQTFESKEILGYANVDIYQGEDLLATVLSDKDGNYTITLDTGEYRAEINYAGFKKIVQNIVVTDDEKVNFNLREDLDSKFAKSKKAKDDYVGEVEMRGYADYSIRMDEAMPATAGSIKSKKLYSISRESYGIIAGDMRLPEQQGVAGKLTAGEINDFGKWDLWTDLQKEELNEYKKLWNYSPEQRYTVQLTDNNGLPIADVLVHLTNKDGMSYFTSRTDNTGKAELWKNTVHSQKAVSEKMSIEVIWNGQKHLINKAKPFTKGINTLTLSSPCIQSQKVDIAFVVDATGSMSDELNFLKAELNDVMFKAKQISHSLNFSFANVFYRDRGDAYLTRTQDFTRVLSESVSFISDQQAGGGGDFEEAVEIALDTAINGLSWSDHARARIVFLILDAPPHNTPEIQQQLQRVSKQAAAKGIRIVPLVASGINKATEYLMRSMALSTNGTYAFLTDDSGIGGFHLKPSTDSYEVEILNDLLVRIIKSYSYMPDCEQTLPDLGLEYPDSTVVVDTTSADTTSTTTPTNPSQISWNFYPNPTRDWVNVKSSVDIPELYLTDLSGKVLQVLKETKANQTVKVDLRGYASGIYLIRYPAGKKWVSGKVVLVRN